MNMLPARCCRQCGADFGGYRASTAIYCSDCYSRLAPARRKKTGGDYACGQVTKAVKNGLIPPAKDLLCVDCGKQATEYDHRDYNEPLKVEPVCHSCNMRRGPAIPLASRAAA
jgi:hypothetical protein